MKILIIDYLYLSYNNQTMLDLILHTLTNISLAITNANVLVPMYFKYKDYPL